MHDNMIKKTKTLLLLSFVSMFGVGLNASVCMLYPAKVRSMIQQSVQSAQQRVEHEQKIINRIEVSLRILIMVTSVIFSYLCTTKKNVPLLSIGGVGLMGIILCGCLSYMQRRGRKKHMDALRDDFDRLGGEEASVLERSCLDLHKSAVKLTKTTVMLLCAGYALAILLHAK